MPNLTSQTVNVFRHRIPPEALPKTFAEAISVAKHLGYGYLWIDSLCILQDSEEDWANESSLMASVYGEADLNIAATAAEDASVGCFLKRKNTWRCQVRHPSRDNVLCEIFPSHRLAPRRDRLAARAWVVQERYLSRRTLHFAEEQVFWECGGVTACETFPMGHPFDTGDLGECAFDLRRQPLTSRSWSGIVSRYSRGDLTYVTDKLVAVAGLARIIQRSSNDDYIAGMWKDGLETQLLWAVDPGHVGTRIIPQIAPTWSWASLHGPIEPASHRRKWQRKLCIGVQGLRVRYATADQFGGAAEATLRLRCDGLFRGIIDGEEVGYKIMKLGTPSAVRMGIRYDCLERWAGMKLANVFALPIRMFKVGLGSSSETEGLLLEPTGNRRGEYRRIGRFYNQDCAWFTKERSAANLIVLKRTSHFAEVAVDADGETRNYIDLV